jgi:hypothetical protein
MPYGRIWGTSHRDTHYTRKVFPSAARGLLTLYLSFIPLPLLPDTYRISPEPQNVYSFLLREKLSRDSWSFTANHGGPNQTLILLPSTVSANFR